MSNIKIITAAFFIGLLCLNSDCNKVEEIPPVNEFFILEGRLVNSCTDNTPKKNWNFICYEDNNYLGRLEVKTDSNGYFRIYSKFKGKNIFLKEDGGKILLYKIPGGKSLNFGEIAYNYKIIINIKYHNFSKLTINDTLNYYVPNKGYQKKIGPLQNDLISIVEINNEACNYYSNNSSYSLSEVSLPMWLNSNTNQIQSKRYQIMPCGINQDLVFDF